MKKISLLLALITLSLLNHQFLAKPFDSSKVVIALNCGAKTQQLSTSEGSFKYIPDEKYVKGSSVGVDYHDDPVASETEIKYALEKQLYISERHTYQQMTYELPVRKGINTIIMKFAEMYFQKEAQRVFNIKIGSKIILENFDVIEKSGARFSAHEEFVEVEVRNDGVYFKGSRIAQGLENNKLRLSFSKGKADNPFIQGIIVYHDSIENSPKKEFLTLKSKWNTQQEMLKAKKEEKQLREMIQIQKKKQKILIRNDQLVLDEDSESPQSQPASSQKFGFLRRVLMGPVGILGWGTLFVFCLIFLYQKVFRMSQVEKSE